MAMLLYKKGRSLSIQRRKFSSYGMVCHGNFGPADFGPKFSLENMVHLLKTLVLGLLSQTEEYKTTPNQRRVSLGNSQCT